MTVVIVEDEKMAADRLASLLHKHNPEIEVLAHIESVKKGIQWFRDQAPPDLVFMDIQLADGLSFEIFEVVEVKAPIIFTTAYDEYALKAFKVNSIDYLLKPIDEDDLEAAFKKLSALRKADHQTPQVQSGQIEELVRMLSQPYKSRFIIKVGEHIKSVVVKDIVCFFSREKATFFTTREPRNYLIDYSLEQVEKMLDPQSFFRVSRKYIIALEAIQDIISYSNSRLKVILQQPADDEIIVSRERVGDFKRWLDR